MTYENYLKFKFQLSRNKVLFEYSHAYFVCVVYIWWFLETVAQLSCDTGAHVRKTIVFTLWPLIVDFWFNA